MFFCKCLLDAQTGLCFDSMVVDGENTWEDWNRAYSEFLKVIQKEYGLVLMKWVEVYWVDRKEEEEE